jgi:hypothetical protein
MEVLGWIDINIIKGIRERFWRMAYSAIATTLKNIKYYASAHQS